MATINGTAGNDGFGTLNGTAGNDTINGFAGDDVLYGAGGQDVLNGGTQNDIFFYQFGSEISDNLGNKDTINGGDGTDTIQVLDSINFEQAAISSVEKLVFTDTLAGDLRFVTFGAYQGGYNLAVVGDTDTDVIQFNMGTQTNLNLSGWTFSNWVSGATTFAGDRVQINGDSDSEIIVGTSINDYIEGAAGGDSLYGNAGIDFLIGSTGNDSLDGGAGADEMYGGSDNDNYYVDNLGDITNDADGTSDVVYSSVTFRAAAGIERLVLTGQGNTNATGRNDQIDRLFGNGGNNILNGLQGGDTMAGGLGNDTYYVDDVFDFVTESGGGGTDFVYSSVSFNGESTAGIERAYLTGTGDINATGRNLQNDILVGNAGINVMNGLAGADVMRGGMGNDTYIVDNAGDTTDEVNGGGGIADYVFSSVSYTSAQGIERLYLTGATAINGTGRVAQNDIITGNTAANVLSGLSGNDVLIGGLGNDTLTGGLNADIFRFDTTINATTNRDTITDFSVADDTIQLENAIFSTLVTTGVLAANLFKNLNLQALDGDDRILYNDTTGAIFYDADGNGAGAAIQFATLTGNPTITAADFLVY